MGGMRYKGGWVTIPAGLKTGNGWVGPQPKILSLCSWITGKKASRNPSDFLERNRLQKVRNPNLSTSGLKIESISSNFMKVVHCWQVPMIFTRESLMLRGSQISMFLICSFQQLEYFRGYGIGRKWKTTCLLDDFTTIHHHSNEQSKARGMEWNLAPTFGIRSAKVAIRRPLGKGERAWELWCQMRSNGASNLWIAWFGHETCWGSRSAKGFGSPFSS